MIVSNKTRELYKSDSLHKNFSIIIGTKVFGNDRVLADSMTIKESIFEGGSFEAVGCVASTFEASIAISENARVVGKKIVVTVSAEDCTDIPLFYGKVDSMETTATKGIMKIIAYDKFYELQNKDITKWWNNHAKAKISTVFNDFCERYSIARNNVKLANGHIPTNCGSIHKAQELSAWDFLRHLCQINGGFGRFNRNGEFEIIYYDDIMPTSAIYPSSQTYPGVGTFPAIPKKPKDNEVVLAFESLRYEDYSISNITAVKVRDTSKSSEYYYGYDASDNGNVYIVQGNIFAFGIEPYNQANLARGIYMSIKDITYTPFQAKMPCYPWIEMGDFLRFWELEGGQKVEKTLMLTSRTMKLAQKFFDEPCAYGEELQSKFITDLGAKIKDVKDEEQKSETEGDGNYSVVAQIEYVEPMEVSGVEGSVDGQYSGVVVDG